jgi:uncharacterized membrane protein YhhN
MVYIFKPLSMVFIIVLAALANPPFSPTYEYFILAGLVVSLAGDIFMMLRKKQFITGLIAFLIAHLLYIAAFLGTMRPHVSPGTAIPFLVYALFMSRMLFPYLGGMKAPVFLYILVISVMAMLAAERYIVLGGTRPFFALLGGMLFVISDSVLAADRFVKRFGAAQPIVLSTYFVAQSLIALSV